MLYFYKQHSLVQPEELHLNGDGVYFNIFTEDSRGEDTTGTLKNIGDDTVLYASIQNAGKNRYMQLTGYLDYQEIPLTFLSEEYNTDNIYLEDGENIIIPFKLDADISSNENHKFLISLFWGTDLHESDTKLKTNNYSLSYDFSKSGKHTLFSHFEIVCLESINSSATSFCDIPIFFLAFLSFSPNNIFIFSTLYSIFNIIENNISLQIRYFQNCHHFLSSTVSGSS